MPIEPKTMSKCLSCVNRKTFSLGDNYPMGMMATFCALGYWESSFAPEEKDFGENCPDYKNDPKYTTLMEAMRWVAETKNALFRDAGGEEAFQKFSDNPTPDLPVEPETK